MRGGGQRVVRILQVMQELENLEEPEWGDSKEERDFVSGPEARSFTATRRGMTGPHPLSRNIAHQINTGGNWPLIKRNSS